MARPERFELLPRKRQWSRSCLGSCLGSRAGALAGGRSVCCSRMAATRAAARLARAARPGIDVLRRLLGRQRAAAILGVQPRRRLLDRHVDSNADAGAGGSVRAEEHTGYDNCRAHFPTCLSRAVSTARLPGPFMQIRFIDCLQCSGIRSTPGNKRSVCNGRCARWVS
jgi:hypothetical protein